MLASSRCKSSRSLSGCSVGCSSEFIQLLGLVVCDDSVSEFRTISWYIIPVFLKNPGDICQFPWYVGRKVGERQQELDCLIALGEDDCSYSVEDDALAGMWRSL